MPYLSCLPGPLPQKGKGLAVHFMVVCHSFSQEVHLVGPECPDIFHVLFLFGGGQEGVESPEDNSLVVIL